MSPTQQFQHPAPVHHLAITQIRPKPEHHYFGHDARHVLSEGMATFWAYPTDRGSACRGFV